MSVLAGAVEVGFQAHVEDLSQEIVHYSEEVICVEGEDTGRLFVVLSGGSVGRLKLAAFSRHV